MSGATRGRTAGLAVLFALALLLHGAAAGMLHDARAGLSPRQSDTVSASRDGWAAEAVLTPVQMATARTQPLRYKFGPWTGTADPDGATLVAGRSVPGASLVGSLLLREGHHAPGAAPWHPTESRAPPSAL